MSPALAGGFFTTELTWEATREIRSLRRENPLEEEMATHFSILAWKIPWSEESGGLQSMGLAKSRTLLSERTLTRREERRVLGVPFLRQQGAREAQEPGEGGGDGEPLKVRTSSS